MKLCQPFSTKQRLRPTYIFLIVCIIDSLCVFNIFFLRFVIFEAFNFWPSHGPMYYNFHNFSRHQICSRPVQATLQDFQFCDLRLSNPQAQNGQQVVKLWFPIGLGTTFLLKKGLNKRLAGG